MIEDANKIIGEDVEFTNINVYKTN